ncbi:MAG: hypothetical protein KAV41_02340 [Candidatus Pacebacteria bacterium]|nr:hypothetical protein [Candidatus Paceibacterota bacterium]
MSKLIVILGPMKGGKSFETIGRFMPLKYTDISFGLFQPKRNVRDEQIQSKNGNIIPSQKISNLNELLNKNLDIIGIDEIHMFEENEIQAIETLLKRKNQQIIMSGLDTDYIGKMFPVIRKILELGPNKIIYKRAVCEVCKKMEAVYTQIFDKTGKPVLDKLPPVVPDDGSYIYKPVCRNCFIRKSNF